MIKMLPLLPLAFYRYLILHSMDEHGPSFAICYSCLLSINSHVICLSFAEQIEDLTARLQGPQGPPGAGYPGAPGEPGPQGLTGKFSVFF